MVQLSQELIKISLLDYSPEHVAKLTEPMEEEELFSFLQAETVTWKAVDQQLVPISTN